MNSKSFTYPEREKLKSRKLIKKVFEEGKTVKSYPILIKFISHSNENHSIGVSVSKRNFRKATDRIRIKRQLREAYRLNKAELQDTANKYALMIIFIGKQKLASDVIHETIKSLFRKMR